MKILFVADGRSPTAINWMQHFIAAGHEVHLASTFPSAPLAGAASHHVIPVAFSGVVAENDAAPGGGGLLKRVTTPQVRTRIRQWAGVLTLPRAARQLTGLIHTLQPDLVHAMRIPFEGMLASLALAALEFHRTPPALQNPAFINLAMRKAPLVISIWGNDFTLHAPANPMMRYRTRQALRLADAIHADCQRDIRLAYEWGFPSEKPFTVLPGGGGVQPDIFYPPLRAQPAAPLPFTIIHPRGMRAYVHNEEFFRAIPLVLAKFPGARFICTGMAGEAQAEAWVRELGIASSVELLPRVPRAEMGDLFRRAQVCVSLTSHDGTPNTLLEALACGCYPVAGDLESIREWIKPGENGTLVNPANPDEIARGIIGAIENPGLRDQARGQNIQIIRERALHAPVMRAAEAFYEELVQG